MPEISREKATSVEECLVYSEDRMEALRRGDLYNPQEAKYRVLEQLLRQFGAGDAGSGAEFAELYGVHRAALQPGYHDGRLAKFKAQYDMLRFDSMTDAEKASILQSVGSDAGCSNLIHPKPSQNQGYFVSNDQEQTLPSRVQPFVTEQLIAETLQAGVTTDSFSKLTQEANGFLFQQTLPWKVCREILNRATGAVPNMVGLMQGVANNRKKPNDPWTNESCIARNIDKLTFEEFDNLPPKVLQEQHVAKQAFLKLVDPMLDLNTPQGSLVYTNRVLNYVDTTLVRGASGFLGNMLGSSNPWEPLRVQLIGNLILQQWRMDRTVDVNLLVEHMKVRLKSEYFHTSGIMRDSKRSKHFQDTHLPGVCNLPDQELFDILRFMFRNKVENGDSSVDRLSELLHKEAFDAFFHEARLNAGLDDDGSSFGYLTQTTARGRCSFLAHGVHELMNEVKLKYTQWNEEHYKPSDPVNLTVQVKNVKEIIVKVFQVNLNTYFRQEKRQVPSDLKLEGLTAKVERTVAVASRNAFHDQEITLDFPELKDVRGVFFVDLIASGKHARAMIRKGSIQFIERLGAAGHVFTLIGEDREHLQGGKIWMSGHEFTAEDDGDIYIPFSTSPGTQDIIISATEYPDFCVLTKFSHQKEFYSFQSKFFIDREQILDKRTAKMIVRSTVTANGAPTSLKICENVKITIETTNTSGISSTKTFDRLELSDTEDLVLTFRVPVRCENIRVNLVGEIKNTSANKKETISANSNFRFNSLVKTQNIQDAHFIPQEQGYVIALLGRNGEPLPNAQTQVTVKHKMLRNPRSFQCATDANGYITLPVLQDVEYVQAFNKTFVLNDSRSEPATRMVVQAGDQVCVPVHVPQYLNRSPEFFNRSGFVRLLDDSRTNDLTNLVTIESSQIVINGLEEGEYTLYFRDNSASIEIVVKQGSFVNNYIIGEKEFTELTTTNDLQILDVETQDDSYLVELSSEYARLHVLATHFHPGADAFSKLLINNRISTKQKSIGKPTSFYLASRTISEEHRYIVERARSERFIGNMLQKPSFLMKPFVSEDASTRNRQAERGEHMQQKMMDQMYADRSMAARRMDRAHAVGRSEDSYIEFLNGTSAVLTNLKPEEIEGRQVVRVPRSAFSEMHGAVHFLAVDQSNVASKQITVSNVDQNTAEDLNLPARTFKYVDLRLNPGLDPEKAFTERKEIHLLNSDQDEYYVEDYKSSEVEFYDNLGDVFTLFKTIGSFGSQLEEFSFMTRWDSLTESEQLDKFDKYTCHELNFFLYMKDRAFFEEVVRPFVQSKLNKDLIDFYLINDIRSLLVFTEMHNYTSLNALEKILLAHGVRDVNPDFTNAVLKHFQSANEHIKITPQELDRLFSFALAGKDTADPVAAPVMLQSVNTSRAPRPRKQRQRRFSGGQSPLFGDDSSSDGDDDRSMGSSSAARSSGMREFHAPKRRLRGCRSKKKSAASMQNRSMVQREKQQQQQTLYRKLDTTKIYEETFYYKMGYKKSKSQLVPMNKFWCDFAEYWLGDQTTPFLSSHLAVPTTCLNESLFALGVFGTSSTAEDGVNVQWMENGVSVRISANKPVVVFSKEIKETQTKPSSVALHQFYFDPLEQTHVVDGERVDKFVTEFVPRKVYGCRTVATNISSATLNNLECLKQIPVGAIALENKDSTESEIISIAPYSTTIIQYLFYFPDVGEYKHFPVQVSKAGSVIGSGPSDSVLTVAIPEAQREVNKESWRDVALNDDPKSVVSYLDTHNVYAIHVKGELSFIYWRLKNEAFYVELVDILRRNGIYDDTVWQYGFMHSSVPEIREYLSLKKTYAHLSQFESPLYQSDEFRDRVYTHLEFFPLVNARAHQLGKKREILNDKLGTQYQKFLTLALKRSTSVTDMQGKDVLAAIYYLLLQDRFSEALQLYNNLDPEVGSAASEFCYDYLRGYLNFLDDEQDVAKAVVEKYADRKLPAAKRKLIDDFQASLDELGDYQYEESQNIDLADRDREMAKKAAQEASLTMKVENRKVIVEHFGLDSVTVNYFKMDVELMFSTSPFSMTGQGGNWNFISPNFSQTVQLTREARVAVAEIPVPDELQFCNVYVEVCGGAIMKSTSYFDSNLIVQLKQNFGQVKVLDKTTKRPIKKAYVKVYAKTTNGNEFYKDGYTDIRGRFDYVSISTDILSRTREYALLVCTDNSGAVVMSANPPKQ